MQPVATMWVEYTTGTLRVKAYSPEGLRYRWRFDGRTIGGATNAALTVINVQTWQAGLYDVIIFNGGNSVRSTRAEVTVLDSVEIVQDHDWRRIKRHIQGGGQEHDSDYVSVEIQRDQYHWCARHEFYDQQCHKHS